MSLGATILTSFKPALFPLSPSSLLLSLLLLLFGMVLVNLLTATPAAAICLNMRELMIGPSPSFRG